MPKAINELFEGYLLRCPVCELAGTWRLLGKNMVASICQKYVKEAFSTTIAVDGKEVNELLAYIKREEPLADAALLETLLVAAFTNAVNNRTEITIVQNGDKYEGKCPTCGAVLITIKP